MRRLLVAGTLVLAVLLLPFPAPPAAGAFFAPLASLDAPHAAVSGGAEPMIFVTSAGTILVGDTAGIHRSTNGGASWTNSTGNPRLPGGFTDGWTLAEDANGRIYTALTQGQLVSLGTSTNGGASFTTTNYAVHAGAVADRPWVAAKGNGEVVVLFYSAGLGEQCLYSNDGGVTFLSRTIANEGFSNAGNVRLDAAGRIWYAEDQYIVRWGPRCEGEPETAWLGLHGPQIFVQLAVTPSGDAFVARPSLGNGRMELTGLHGLDRSSMKTIGVSPATVKSSTFGAIASRGNDEIAVAWYGSATAGNPAGTFTGSWDVYVTRVTGFWTATPTLTTQKVTTTPNHVGGFCMSGITCTSGDRDLLDYMGVTYDAAGNVHVAYGHDGSGNRAEVRYAMLSAL